MNVTISWCTGSNIIEGVSNGPRKSQSRKILVKFHGSRILVFLQEAVSESCILKTKEICEKASQAHKKCLVLESCKVSPWPFNTPFRIFTSYNNNNTTLFSILQLQAISLSSILSTVLRFCPVGLNPHISAFTLVNSYARCTENMICFVLDFQRII